ncbi:MAG: type III-A CRISPR-associated protein Csm2 [Anaerolineales bacterium]|nr:type III-A CRISPR-associated protein Csm2 [Anaerolineales bacterium]
MPVFSFQLSQLEKIISNPKDRDKERQFLERKLKEWNPKSPTKIELEAAVLLTIITTQNSTEEGSAQLLVQWADRLGAIFKSTGLTSSQIRNFFSEIRTIQQYGFEDVKMKRRFILLIPKLEYAAARAKKFGMDGFRDVLTEGIRNVENSSSNFDRFAQFFEAILAYHKAYGGN